MFQAIDGRASPPPSGWKHGPGAWGCLNSHRQVLQSAIDDGAESLLVLEDDVCFTKNFRSDVKKFLSTVPNDWDQLMIGGQHINKNGPPALIKSGVYGCTDCERTHCYAVRGQYMQKLLERWRDGGTFSGLTHCDYIMGRDPDLQLTHKVYAPEFFLAGQERCRSDISGQFIPRKFWNPPGPELAVVNLHASSSVAPLLRRQGFYLNQAFNGRDGKRKTLDQAFKETENDFQARIRALREWIILAQWELASDPAFICTIWHPQATPELVHAASLWEVYEVTANNIQDALGQLPLSLRKKLTLLDSRVNRKSHH